MEAPTCAGRELGEPVLGSGELATAQLLVSAWLINLAVAECVIRRRPAVRGRVAVARPA